MAINNETLIHSFSDREKIQTTPIEIGEQAVNALITEKLKEHIDLINTESINRGGEIEPTHLFTIDGNGGWISSTEPNHPGYSLDAQKLQTVVLAALEEYGLDFKTTDGLFHAVAQHTEDTILEQTLYPSQTRSGLAFRRDFEYVDTRGAPVSVSWYAQTRNVFSVFI